MDWPKKDEREQYEINQFTLNYKMLECARNFEIVEKGECPDYIVKDADTDELFGIELTSVYLSDRSVPDEHIPDTDCDDDPFLMPLNRDEINEYGTRIIEAIKTKVLKARKGYNLNYPLILSVYVNEYRSIYMCREDWQNIICDNNEVFDHMAPFREILFWSLANGDVLLVTPDKNV